MSARAAGGQFHVEGVAAPVDLLIDGHGITHIRAASLDDLFFAQGFNAARDRLFQLDLWRKRGLGRLAADFGPGFIAQDRAARAFLYRGDMAAEYAAYGPDTAAICTAFVAGINAVIGLIERGEVSLPEEFTQLGTQPQRWQAEDVLRIRTHGLSKNLLSKIARAAVLARADLATDQLRRQITPFREPDCPVDPARVPPAAADLFRLAQANVTLTPERLAAGLGDAEVWARVSDLNEVLRAEAEDGSNNWAIAASRSATGRPILASDPHRAHSVPSLRYLVHLTAPGFDAIGAGEPCLPGISLGHNGTAAFGLTIFGGDQEEVFVYDTDPADAARYRYKGNWERFETVTEPIAVRGHPDQTIELTFSRHGPVVWRDEAHNSAVGVGTVWLLPGSNPYAASLDAMRATTLPEFRKSLRRWGSPSINMVYADTAGDIAWLPAGHVPERRASDGLLPVPGDGSHDWDGLRDPGKLPATVNPACGYVYSANEMNLPEDWPHETCRIGHDWIESSRATRIREVLAATPRHSLADSCALQTDVTSIPARRLGALVARLSGGKAASGLLTRWDHRLTADSAAAALFEVWFSKHLKPQLFACLAPDPAVRALLAPGDVGGILAALEHPDHRFGSDPAAARDALLVATLDAAFADCAARMGSDPAHWAWGRLHHGAFDHAISPLVDADMRSRFNVGSFPMGGSGSTPMHTGYRPADFRVMHGASVRLVMDVGNWDNSLCLNAPGQSGDPASPHYRDLAPVWAAGQYVPMLYSAAAVEAATVRRVRICPATRQG